MLGNILIYFSHPRESTLPPAMPTKAAPTTQPRDFPTTAHSDQASEEKKAIVAGLEHRRGIVPLERTRLAFEIDMCIGCNRCMDACPLPSSSQITIAALNHATITENIVPAVEQFTHECIMCGSCVPVCPVDNHRDLLMLSLKQRLGTAWERLPDPTLLEQTLPAGWTLPRLLQCLREQVFFRHPQHVPDTYLLHILASSELCALTPGTIALREGAYGRDFYLILEGQLELTTTDRNDKDFPVAILRRGEYVGEEGMLTGQTYKTSARASSPTLLLQIPEQVMQHLMELVPTVRQHLESFGQGRSLLAILNRMALFNGVAETDLQALIHQMQIQHYDRDERLFAESARGRPSRETLHILLEGFVKVARQSPAGEKPSGSDERIIAYRQGGDYFAGGLDLLGDGQAVTVTTINRCRVAVVPRQAILWLFQLYPEVEQRFATRIQQYLDTAASAQRESISTQAQPPLLPTRKATNPNVHTGLHALVGNGVVEGTEVLVIDLDKCIHCNECEYACERRHGHSRMNRKGMVIGNISITTTCRQCQNPVCMLCSRAGIARHPDGEIYITESCIGCGICAERCPYGAISIAQIKDEPENPKTWQRFSAWFSNGTNKERSRKTLPMVSAAVAGGNRALSGPLTVSPPKDGYDELRKKIAIKCDLCAGYKDQACVQACPAGAAFRIQPTRFFGSTEEILRQRN